MNRVVVVGGGVSGRALVKALRFAPVRVTLVDRAAESRFSQPNLEWVQAEALYLDARGQRVILQDRALRYDVLVAAAGSRPCYPRESWAEFAPAWCAAHHRELIRQRLRAQESPAVVIGAGHSGVELAAAIARMDPVRHVILLEGESRILGRFPEELAEDAGRQLCRLGVDVRCGAHVVGVDRSGVKLTGGTRIRSGCVFWAGGVQGAEFGAAITRETGAASDEAGRVRVDGMLNVPGRRDVFVIGAMAAVQLPVELVEAVAEQQGRYAAAAIRARLAGYDVPPFHLVDPGCFVRIGRGGVAMIGEIRLKGAAAWLASRVPQPLRVYSAVASAT